MARLRADVLVQQRGLAESRTRAQALTLAGEVVAGDHRVEKPGQLLDEDCELRLKGGASELRYVSRGGLKLEQALDHFALDPRGLLCCDLGASTGGFTDVLLQRGAARVHAVDVGYGQLHQRLRGDARVVVHERVNARALSPAALVEAGGAEVGKGGVVRDPEVHARVVAAVEAALGASGLEVLGTVPSPILGPAGNREFLTAARRA